MLGLSEQNRNGVLLVIAVVLLLVGYRVKIEKDRDNAAADPRPTTTTVPNDGSTTSTTMGLAVRTYKTGECVTWESVGGFIDTDVVSCGRPHRVQITAKVELPEGGEYPSEAGWVKIFTDRCGPAAQTFLGYPIDPYGRFSVGGIHPLEDAWDVGNRTLWCGIRASGDAESDDLSPPDLRQDIRGADQQYHYKPGDCVDQPAARLPRVVPCTQPHQMEIVGQLDLSDRAAAPTLEQQQDFFAPCRKQAKQHLGAEPAKPWSVLFEPMSPEAWAAKSRIIHCFVGQLDPNNKQLTTSQPAPRVAAG